jgi:hypothetical protein
MTRSSDAVASACRSSRAAYQRSLAPQATAKPSLASSSPALANSARDSALGEAEQRRVEQRHVVAAELPVRRRQQRPRQVAGGDAVAGGGVRGERQQAVAAAPAPRGGEGALVRRREAAGVAFVAAGRREQREQALEVRQRQVAQHVLAGFRAIGRERNEQVHAAIIGAPRGAKRRWVG